MDCPNASRRSLMQGACLATANCPRLGFLYIRPAIAVEIVLHAAYVSAHPLSKTGVRDVAFTGMAHTAD